jgi:iron complex outermembrane recepter protein
MTRSRLRKLKRLQGQGGRRALAAPLAAAMALTAPGALAQQSSEGVLENVVVTAQKRQETLQEVPLSVQAFTTETLEQLNISDFDDYAKFLPNVAYQTLGPGFGSVYMRGVASGGDGNHSGSMPSVGVYLDEQPITTIQGNLDIHLYDVARVEALGGPQGTLYGASSQAGTLRIITNKPDPTEFDAGYGLEVNTVADGGDGYVAEAFVNVPLTERSAVRLVGWKRSDGGYIDNVAGSRAYPSTGITPDNSGRVEDDYNDVDTIGARAALRIDLNENWTVTPGVMGQDQEAHGSFGFDPSVGEFKVAHQFPEYSRDKWTQAALTVEGKIANLDMVYAGSLLNRSVDTNSDYADYSYHYDRCCEYGLYWYDDDFNPIDFGQYVTGKDRYKKESHELRFSSDASNRVRFVAGLFMQRQEHDIEQRYSIGNLASFLEVTGWDDTLWLTEQERIDRDYAVFGEVTYDVTDALSVTGGLRYFKAENSLIGFFGFADDYSGSGRNGETLCSFNAGDARFDTSSWQPFEGINTAPCTNLNDRVEEEDTIHKLNVAYKLDEDRMVYATWSRGYRPGGINRVASIPPYLSDFLTNYELGWKTTWAGNRLRFNGAVFHQDWEDFQFSFLGQNGLTIIRNAAQARINGIEVDLSWAVSSALTVSAGAAYTDAELTENYCGTVYLDTSKPVTDCSDPNAPEGTSLQAPKGTELPVTPKFKTSLTARYEFGLGGFDAHVQGAVVYQDDSWSDLRVEDREIIGVQPSYTLVDLTAGLGRGSYGFELFANNVFDEVAEVSRGAQCSTLNGDRTEIVCGAQPYVYAFRPRTIGLKFTQKF